MNLLDIHESGISIKFSFKALREKKCKLEEQLQSMTEELRTKNHEMEKAKIEVNVRAFSMLVTYLVFIKCCFGC